MAKLLLEIEEDYAFKLVGICSHIKDYRLVWELNKHLGLDLCKDSNYELQNKGASQSHVFHHFCDEENLIDYFLIGNRSNAGLLIPEESKCDYLFVIKGNISESDVVSFLDKMNNIKTILTAYTIDVEALRSKENLLF